ncbi:MAG: hypothetical protein ACRC1K_20330 [Planctomycetia bacterium]
MDAAGNFVVVWNGPGAGDSYGTYARRFSAAGEPRGPELLVNSRTIGLQVSAAVAMDADGDFVVTWRDADGDGAGIFLKRFNAEGDAQSGEIQVNSQTINNQYNSVVAMDADGDFVVAWISDNHDGSATGVFAQRFDKMGAPQGPEFLVNAAYTTSHQKVSHAAMDANGDFIITWDSYFQDGSGYGSYARLYTPSGGLKREIRLNANTAGSQTRGKVAFAANGDFVAVWSEATTNSDIFARRFSADGTAKDTQEFKVNTFTNGDQILPTVAVEPTGDFLVTWESSGPGDGDADGDGVFLRRFKSDGVPKEPQEFLVNTVTARGQNMASVEVDADGDFVVVWRSNGQDGSEYGIYARRYTTDDQASTPTLNPTPPNSGDQGAAIPLTITVSSNDVKEPSETIRVRIEGAPEGTVYSAGPVDENGSIELTEAQLSGLTVTFPPNFFSPTPLPLTVVAWSIENVNNAKSPDTLPRTLNVTIRQVSAAPPVIDAPGNEGNQDSVIPLTLSVVKSNPQGDETLTVRITNVPPGAQLLLGGQPIAPGTTLTPDQLGSLAIRPAAGSVAPISLSVEATATRPPVAGGDSETATKTLNVTVNRLLASVPTLNVGPVVGDQDSTISLGASALLNGPAAEQTLAVRVTGELSGATLLVDGQPAPAILTGEQFARLAIRPAPGFFGTITLAVEATATRTVGGDTKTTSKNIGITVERLLASVPTLNVNPVTGNQDSTISLGASASLNGPVAEQTLTVRVTGELSGATLLVDGQPAPAILTGEQFARLAIRPAPGFVGTITLAVEATATRTVSGHTERSGGSIGITVRDAAVSGIPTLAVAPVGFRLTAVDPIPLGITATTSDPDSETVVVTVAGVPAGASLTAGVDVGGGVWRLTQADLPNLRLVLPVVTDGLVQLTVTATITESNGGATTSESRTVTIANTAPVLTAGTPNTTGAGTTRGATATGLLTRAAGGRSFVVGRARPLATDTAGAQRGIAMTQVRVSGGGAMEYRIGNGRWRKMPRLSASRALLLKAGDRIRYTGAGRVQMQYAAWDQTSGLAGQQISAAGRGGNTAFSARQARATVGGAKRSVETAGLGLSAALAETTVPKATAAVLSAKAVDAAFVDFAALLDAD